MAQQDVTFFNGAKMPIVGLGTWQATDESELEKTLDLALSLGYRHIDTAYMYENEKNIGKVLKKWLDSGKIKREELFIVTKLPPIGMRREHVAHFLEMSLKNLQLDYVDLYLVHMPMGLKYQNDETLWPVENGKMAVDMTTNLEEIWKALEEQVDAGKAKSIGISNFSTKQIERIMKIARIQPANHQVELHAFCQRKALRETCKKHNITICAYAPIGSPGREQLFKKRGLPFIPIPLMDNPVVIEVAKAHGKTTAQVLLRFLTQQNIVVIPKSTNPDRLKANFEISDFTLTDGEMKKLEALDKGAEGQSFVMKNFQGFGDHPECSTQYE